MKKTTDEIVPGLHLPMDAVTRRMAVIATSGAGKTYGAMKLAEIMLAQKHQVIALDVAGPWWGLRLAADGESPGFNVAVFGGPHGDVPLVADGGALLADTLVDTRVSAVIDLSEFSDAEIARFCSAFAERFFSRKKSSPSPVHLFIEEAHELMPQNPEREQNLMLNRWKKLTRQGRNHGIGWTLVSQAPQSLNKRCLNLAECVITLRLFGAHERKAVTDWVAQVAPDPKQAVARINADSPYLDDGHAFVWSPQWLKRMGEKPLKIRPKTSFDSSKTPEPGDPVIETLPPPKALDLDALAVAMKDAVEKAKADDPKALRTEIARLNAQVKRLNAEPARVAAAPPVAAPAKVEIKVVEVPMITEKDVKRYEDACARLSKVLDKHIAELAPYQERLTAAQKQILGKMDAAMKQAKLPITPPPRGPAPPPPPRRQPRAAADSTPGNGAFSAPQHRILDAIAWFETLGTMEPSRSAVALVAGVRPTSGSYANNLSTLSTAGMISYPSRGAVALTDKGRAEAQRPDVSPADENIQAMVLGLVSAPQAAILRVLIAKYPERAPRAAVAEEVGVSPTSGSYANNLSTLSTLGVLEYPSRGEVVASSLLFPASVLTAAHA